MSIHGFHLEKKETHCSSTMHTFMNPHLNSLIEVCTQEKCVNFFSIAVKKSCRSPMRLNPWGTNDRKSAGCWGDMLGFIIGPDRGSRKIDSMEVDRGTEPPL